MEIEILILLAAILGSLIRPTVRIIRIFRLRLAPFSDVLREYYSWKKAADEIFSTFIAYMSTVASIRFIADPDLPPFQVVMAFLIAYFISPLKWQQTQEDESTVIAIEDRIRKRAEILEDEKGMNLVFALFKSKLVTIEGSPRILAETDTLKKKDILLRHIPQSMLEKKLTTITSLGEWRGKERRKGPLDRRLIQEKIDFEDRRRYAGRRDYDMKGGSY